MRLCQFRSPHGTKHVNFIEDSEHINEVDAALSSKSLARLAKARLYD